MAVSFGFRAGSLAIGSGEGGGGIPSELQTNMDAVFNKKFGTSGQTYDSDGWPNDVNLMGPLPEKSASGSIVTFSDGADDVPLKSWEVALPASLDGYSSVDVVQTGKNLVNIPDSAEITRNQLNSNVVPLLDDFLNGKKGNFTISAKTAETVENANFITIRINYTDSTSSSNVYMYRGSTHESGGITGTFSISSDPTKIIDSISFGGNTGTAKCAVSEWQIEANSQATTYEPYTAPTTHTVQLGRTIYGGVPDVVNGEGTETYNGLDLSTLTWSGGIIGGQMWCWYCDISSTNPELPSNSNIFDGMSDNYTPIRFNGVSNTADTIAIRSNGVLYVNNGSDTVEPTGHVTYKLATPIDFTFTGQETNTRLGNNTMWSDGEMSVVYRSSGTVTPIVPTLISKTITANGTYSAEDDGADGYSSVTVEVPSLPSGDYDDPFGITSDFSKYNVDSLYSCYYIDNGVLRKEIVAYIDAQSGYEGFCINLSKFNLVSGKQYGIIFGLEMPSNFTFTDYDLGLKHETTRRPSSGAAGAETFNVRPTVNFLKQTGMQSILFSITAGNNNYLSFVFSGVEGGKKGWVYIRDFIIREA